jgi:propanol-preferring alcohol dehydrogenase
MVIYFIIIYIQSSGYQQAIDYLRAGGTLMAVGLPGSAKLEASIWFTVFKVSSSTPPFVIEIRPLTLARYAGQSISILGSYVGNRQDSIEALDIAARGDVKCHFVLKDLADLKEYVVQSSLLRCMFDSLI